MSDRVKHPDGQQHADGLLRPGEIRRAVGSRTFGFPPRPGTGAVPRADDDAPALRLASLSGRRGRAPAGSAPRDPPQTSVALQPATAQAQDPSALRLLERQEVAPGLLRLRVERPAGFDFRAGQHVKFGLPGNRRSYTLASAPDEPHLEFFIELRPGGRLSEPLRSVGEGARMAIGPAAKGSFVVDRSVAHHVLVATVTGIAPFVSILRDQARRGFPAGRFLVLHGASHAEELGYGDELARLAAAHPDRVEYLPTISRSTESRNQGWTGSTGRVDSLLAPALSRRRFPPGDTAVYACGHSGMIRNVRAQAGRQRLPFHAEAFD